MAVGRAFRVNEDQIKAYEVARPRKPLRRLRRNPLGVTAIMGVANKRGAYKKAHQTSIDGIKIHKTPPKKYRKLGFTKRSQYALPKAYAYPVGDRKHVIAAVQFLHKHGHKYSPKVRREIEQGIARAAKRLKVETPSVLELRKKYNLNTEESGMLFTYRKRPKRRVKRNAASKTLRHAPIKVRSKKTGRVKARRHRTAGGRRVVVIPGVAGFGALITNRRKKATKLTYSASRTRKGKGRAVSSHYISGARKITLIQKGKKLAALAQNRKRRAKARLSWTPIKVYKTKGGKRTGRKVRRYRTGGISHFTAYVGRGGKTLSALMTNRSKKAAKKAAKKTRARKTRRIVLQYSPTTYRKGKRTQRGHRYTGLRRLILTPKGGKIYTLAENKKRAAKMREMLDDDETQFSVEGGSVGASYTPADISESKIRKILDLETQLRLEKREVLKDATSKSQYRSIKSELKKQVAAAAVAARKAASAERKARLQELAKQGAEAYKELEMARAKVRSLVTDKELKRLVEKALTDERNAGRDSALKGLKDQLGSARESRKGLKESELFAHKKVADIEAEIARLHKEEERLRKSGKVTLQMNKKRAKSKRARKSGTRRTGRGRRRAVAKFRGLRLAARRPSRKPRRHAGRRRTLKRAIGRVSRRKTRRAAPKRRARKHGLKMNRRRRHFRSNAIFASIQNLFMQALPVVGGLLAHKVLTGLVVSNLMKNSTMKGKESLVGLAVAIGGFMAMDKFAPAHSLKFGMGMVASEVHTVIKELVPGMSQYGLGASQSLMPRYTLGEYYQPTAGYYEAAAGNPYFQAAAGAYTEAAVGEYYRGDAAQLPRAAAGEYYTSGLTVQGTSDYEITNNVSGVGASPMYEGVVPDSNLDRELDFIEAAAGVGAPNRAAPGARSIYQPAENALTVGSSNSVPQGVFEAPGGSGILS